MPCKLINQAHRSFFLPRTFILLRRIRWWAVVIIRILAAQNCFFVLLDHHFLILLYLKLVCLMKTQETNSSSQKVNNQNGTKMKVNQMNNINLPNHTTREQKLDMELPESWWYKNHGSGIILCNKFTESIYIIQYLPYFTRIEEAVRASWSRWKNRSSVRFGCLYRRTERIQTKR